MSQLRLASPAVTNCSELDYLIALQSEEFFGSQLRRSQRLWEKKLAAPKTVPIIINNVAINNGAGSPQLFMDTDEEFSQLAQRPPKQTKNPVSQDVAAKSTAPETSVVEPTKPKRGRKSRSQTRSNSRARKAATLSSKLRLKGMQIKKLPPTMMTQTIVIPSDSSASVADSRTQQKPTIQPTVPVSSQLTESNIKIFQQSKLQSHKTIVATSKVKRERSRKQPAAAEKLKAEATVSHLPIYTNQQHNYPTVVKANPQLTQTILPERYPAHFIHQLPPASTGDASNALPASTRVMPPTSLHQMCPTPDTTPTAGNHDSYSPSPPHVDSMISTTPSLSESLAEIFGTKKIRNILNIEPPRKYLVLEVQLPAIAFMLDVELGRLQAVLAMTQSLTLEQMEQMQMQESQDVISIHSTSSCSGDANKK